jgi:Mrp family chromosome partitioning ATPase
LDSIIQAIDLVRAGEVRSAPLSPAAPQDRRIPVDQNIRKVVLDPKYLDAQRIVTHRATPESRAFDVLRTQVLQDMDKNGWQFLAVTSPTADCGKSTLVCNLATSIARLSDRAVMLVDMDLRNPTIAKYLGVRCDLGIVDVLQGKALLADAMVNAVLESNSVLLLPGTGKVLHSSDLMASQLMANTMQMLKREFRNRTVIFDLPSVLGGDDVISILPRMDAAMLVVAAGKSTIEDVRECKRYLENIPIVRVVVNEVPLSKVGDARF